MRPYYHLFHQEQSDVYHKTPQEVLILVLGELYSSCYMIPELASKYNPWQVGIVIVFYGISEIHGWSSIDVNESQAQCMLKITHIPWPSFGSKRNGH